MTSAAKIRANQRNAKKSTGPRSVEGKAKASQNALRHGLTVPISCDPKLVARVEALATALGQPGIGDAGKQINARAAAEAILNCRRVAEARLVVYETVTESSLDTSCIFTGSLDVAIQTRAESTDEEQEAIDLARQQALNTFESDLCALDRYERRFASRRKTLLRELVSASAKLPGR